MAEAVLKRPTYKSRYNLNGLTCSNCASKIEKAVQELSYVMDAELNFALGKITVTGTNHKIEEMTKKIQAITDRIEPGISVEKDIKSIKKKNTHKFKLEGLTCSNCATKIENAVNDLPQVDEAVLNYATSTIMIKGKNIEVETLIKEVKKISDRIEPGLAVHELGKKTFNFNNEDSHNHTHEHEHVHAHETQNSNKENSYLKYRFLPGLILFGLAIILYEVPFFKYQISGLSHYLEWIFYGFSYFLIGGPVLNVAYQNIKRGQVFDENFLMAVATIGAFAIQEFPEGVAVMLFYMIGEMFQDRAVQSSRRSIKSLMDIRPDYANLKQGDNLRKVAPDFVNIGAHIVIKPGEKVPLDGKVVEGNSMVDTSALTGESIPRKIETDDEILSGMINKEGLLTVKVTKEYGQSTVAKILQLVENASGKKANTEKFITKFSRYYTPVVVYSALAIAILPPLFLPDALFSNWIYRALIFLVVSCPCALVVSIPLGFFGGIGRASKQGILVKGGNYLEALNNVTQIVFDKTGTLTEGKFAVNEIIPGNSFSKRELLKKAAYAESHSNHPIAKSILEAYNQGIDNEEIKKYQEISGHGIKAIIGSQEVLVGNGKLMVKEKVDYQQANADGTIIYIAIDREFAGYIKINDKLKDDSFTAIKDLKKVGVNKITMLTGDRKSTAQQVSQKLGLDNYYAELLPHQKVEIVEELINNKHKNEKLIFVGDGINDAPVLARADIGVAMGGLGSDAAIEAADIVLMTDEPSKLVTAINTARKTRNIVWQNVILALGVKGIVLLMGALGIATMWEAVFADVGVALLAVLNAMRISRNV